jgi:hypothetical protein
MGLTQTRDEFITTIDTGTINLPIREGFSRTTMDFSYTITYDGFVKQMRFKYLSPSGTDFSLCMYIKPFDRPDRNDEDIPYRDIRGKTTKSALANDLKEIGWNKVQDSFPNDFTRELIVDIIYNLLNELNIIDP